MGERESGNPQEGGHKRALPRRSHEEQYIDLTCHIISVHKTIEKKFKCNKCPYISAYSLAMDWHVRSVHDKIKSHMYAFHTTYQYCLYGKFVAIDKNKLAQWSRGKIHAVWV